MKYDQDHTLIATIEQFIDSENRTILEIGCGDGSNSALLAHKAKRYIAIDPDGEAIGRARSLISDVDFQVGTGERLGFADSSFEVVIFILSLHHQDSRTALEEARRVLASAGRLIILEPAAEGELQQFFHLFHDESAALAQAADAIEKCPFHLASHITFNVSAEFDDLVDLCQYPFDRTIISPEDRPRILDKLMQLRASSSAVQSIHLLDRIHLYLLENRP